MAEKFDYYLCKGGNWSGSIKVGKLTFFGSNDKHGFIIGETGLFYPGYDTNTVFQTQWNNRWVKGLGNSSAESSTLENCLKLIDKKKYKSNYLNIFKVLGIKLPDYKPIELTDKTKDLVISMLKNERARNGDSAHRFNYNHFDEGILDAMVELNLIKTLDGEKFWVEMLDK